MMLLSDKTDGSNGVDVAEREAVLSEMLRDSMALHSWNMGEQWVMVTPRPFNYDGKRAVIAWGVRMAGRGEVV
jgi:hypothetical protein